MRYRRLHKPHESTNYSICRLQNLEYLSIEGSKFVKYLRRWRILTNTPISSTKESTISSGAELLQLLPSTNLSDSNDGCCSMAFQKLRQLDLSNCALSYSYFLRTFDCGFTLYQTIKQTAIKQQDANKAKPECKTKQASCHQGNRIDDS
jgi:hypothetical protein